MINQKFRVSGSLNNTDIVMNRTFWIGLYPAKHVPHSSIVPLWWTYICNKDFVGVSGHFTTNWTLPRTRESYHLYLLENDEHDVLAKSPVIVSDVD
jgi:hypothetical protein